MTTDRQSRWMAAAELGRRALSTTDHAALLTAAVETVSVGLGVELSSFVELLPDGRVMFQAGVGWEDAIAQSPAREMSADSAPGYVVRLQTPLMIDDLHSEQRFATSPLWEEHGVVSSLLVPLFGRNRPWGALGAHARQPRKFTAEEAAWLQVVANALSAAFEQRSRSKAEQDKRFLRAEQMMAIGQVAAGVAHELRNPLTSIKGLVQVNLRELESRGLPSEDLTVIEHEIRRMEKTLQTFLDFARPPEPHRRRHDLGKIVERVLALAGGRARKQQVALRFLKTPMPVEAEVDGDQIQQLLLNLVLNALDAMPQGGTVEVDLRPARDGFVELYVRDTGPGIAPHILPKVFETFVSSKETGVGLGLPLSLRIAEDHGGSLFAFNLPVSGACFLLRLPAATVDRESLASP
jgi:signal transduction histidine kinase